MAQATNCSFCGRDEQSAGPLSHGSSSAAVWGNCAARIFSELEQVEESQLKRGHGLVAMYQYYFRDPRRERQFISSVSFFFTFALVRVIVRSIQLGKGPFHNVSAGGRHIHHLVFGITSLLGVGFLWLHQIGTGAIPPRKWMRATAVLYGAGSALTLDEFALWLNLKDDYFTPEGRESVDAVILFGSVLSIGFWGQPFLKELTRRGVRKVTPSN